MEKKIRTVGMAFVLVLWATLTVAAWVKPATADSEAERRPLAQFPQLNTQTLFSGRFMQDFESYTLDQFPGRDRLRQVKALFHYYALGQKDNNGIYIADGYAAKLEYPLNEASVNFATKKLGNIYETYLKPGGCTVISAVVPDKSYYLAQENGYPAMDYSALFAKMQTNMPWATHVDLTDCLTKESYYRTDTHWRQEDLLPVAQKLSTALGVQGPGADFEKTPVDRPFYGVYYGQAALPMEPDTMYILESEVLKDCRVYSYETGKTTTVYDMEKCTSRDLYDVYLSGAQSLLRIENPNATTDRELIVFRDSFGSSLVPLLVQDYAAITLVDIRYIASDLLGEYVDFTGKDVLFLYSTLVLNGGMIFK